MEFANESYAVNVDNGTLTIAKDDDRAWHENIRLFSIGDTYVRIYLPEESYTSEYHGFVYANLPAACRISPQFYKKTVNLLLAESRRYAKINTENKEDW